jgi:hypothetical protein
MSVGIMALVFASDLPTIDRFVALALADHAHDDGTRVWPSIASLSTKVGMGTTATRNAVHRLEADGVIVKVREGGGRNRPSEYRFNPDWLKATHAVGFLPDDNPTPESEKPYASTPETLRLGVAESSTTEPSTTESSRTRAREEAIAFETFYRHTYPRREGKGAARTAWAKAIGKTDAATIIAGAARYRDDPNRDPGYTAHPATWLNQERWDDDPLPPRNGHKPGRHDFIGEMANELEARGL